MADKLRLQLAIFVFSAGIGGLIWFALTPCR
jgi:hypothetical protein